MAKRKKSKTRKARPMKNNECRITKDGRKYCKKGGRVRFVKAGTRSRAKSKSKTGSLAGQMKVCVRKKRVRSKSGKLVTRCAQFRDVTY